MNRLLFVFTLLLSFPVMAWDGYDSETMESVEIEKGNLVREGLDVEIYDHGDGSYKTVEVQSMKSYGNTVEMEVYDYDSGEYRTLEMDGY